MTPEERLVFHFARPRPRDADRDAARRAIAEGVDWRRVRDLAGAQRVHLVLGRNLERLEDHRPAVPAPLRRAFVESRLSARVRLHAYRRAVAPVLRALRDAGTPALLLKGAALSEGVVEPGLRVLVDYDLLVQPGAYACARAALLDAGFTVHPRDGLSEREARRTYHQVEFARGDLLVDLHWRLYPPGRMFGIDGAALFATSRPAGDGRAMAPEETFVHLATQLATDRLRFTMGRIVDLATLVAHGLDFARVVAVAERAGAAGVVRVALAMTAALGEPAPAAVLRRLDRIWPPAAAVAPLLADPRLIVGRRVAGVGAALVLLPLLCTRPRPRLASAFALPVPALDVARSFHALKPVYSVFSYRRRVSALARGAAAAAGLAGFWGARLVRARGLADPCWRALFPIRRRARDAAPQRAEQEAVRGGDVARDVAAVDAAP
jgi:hypothetical protein